MNYTFLRFGDQLPSVGVLQKLLIRANAKIVADGIFGPKTLAAVKDFQRSCHISVDGDVGKDTWEWLVQGVDLPIFDCVDVFDATKLTGAVADFRLVGGNPILIGGMSNGVQQAISEICRVARNTFLLRFTGHGAPGDAVISGGHGELDPNYDHRSGMDTSNIHQFQDALLRLRSVFGPYGTVQFMHCSVGRDPKGTNFLTKVANYLGVPATAGINLQYSGGGLPSFRFEGPTKTVVPGGKSLKEWCRALPDFPKKTQCEPLKGPSWLHAG